MKNFELGDCVLIISPNASGSGVVVKPTKISGVLQTGYVSVEPTTFLKFNAKTGFNPSYSDKIVHDTKENREFYENHNAIERMRTDVLNATRRCKKLNTLTKVLKILTE